MSSPLDNPARASVLGAYLAGITACDEVPPADALRRHLARGVRLRRETTVGAVRVPAPAHSGSPS